MSEEEKKAIEILKELRRYYEAEADKLDYRGTLTIPVDEDDSDAIETMLNLIEKQQKEIEELKKENKQLRQRNKNLVAEIEYLEEKNDE